MTLTLSTTTIGKLVKQQLMRKTKILIVRRKHNNTENNLHITSCTAFVNMSFQSMERKPIQQLTNRNISSCPLDMGKKKPIKFLECLESHNINWGNWDMSKLS
jgi:hypothetical protein